jgi:hypothetical protein
MGNPPNMWKLNNIPLNKSCSKEESTREFRKIS